MLNSEDKITKLMDLHADWDEKRTAYKWIATITRRPLPISKKLKYTLKLATAMMQFRNAAQVFDTAFKELTDAEKIKFAKEMETK